MKRALLLLVALGCGSNEGATPSPGEAPSAAHARTGSAAPHGLHVGSRPGIGGEIFPLVDARADERVRVASRVRVESQREGRWSEVAVSALSLRPSCEAEAPACIELARGGGLRPPAWNGRLGRGQCTTATDGSAAPEGTYRFVVTTCEGDHRIEGEPFALARP